MKQFSLGLLIIFSLFLSGCMSVPTNQFVSSRYYGPQPEDTEVVAKKHFYYALIDGESAVYQVNPRAIKIYSYNPFGPEKLNLAKYGWLIDGKLNAKNKFGGYTGWKDFYLIYRNGEVVESEMGRNRPFKFVLAH
ncbi:MAG: hypothetical protein ISR69_13455 [Gammaproteobacteria bacterium]|nr:hypothetical protein [Candidatus Brocadiales bacterium]MBL7005018.1 hypothetical protein [Gammaproteobacteria bacterium]